MRYKGQYKPSELLDPVGVLAICRSQKVLTDEFISFAISSQVEYQWAPLDACVPKLEQQKYTTFIPTSDEAEKWRSASNNPKLIKDSEIGAMRTLFQGEVHNIRVG